MKFVIGFLKLFIPGDANLMEGMLIFVGMAGAVGTVLFASLGVHELLVESSGYPPINPIYNLAGNAVVGMIGYVMYWIRSSREERG